jgi:hypothetical protein
LTKTEKSARLKFKAVYLKSAWKCNSWNLQGTCWGLFKLVTDYGNIIRHWRFVFYIPTWTSSLQILVHWVTNKGKGSTRIFPPWRKDMQENSSRTC